MRNRKKKHRETHQRYSISLIDRNSVGAPTGGTLDFSTDSPYKLWEFYRKNFFPENKRASINKSTNSNFAEKYLKTSLDGFCEKVKSKKRPTFDDGESV